MTRWYRSPLAFALVGIILITASPTSPAQGLETMKANYTKYEYQIPMRDGVKLFTVVLVPKDSSKSHPILLNRTPYAVGPYGEDHMTKAVGPSPAFTTAGYIFASQDVRGRWMSGGEFVNVRPLRTGEGDKAIDESTDTFDTIDWLVKNIPNNNGRVGQWGISYPGFYTAWGLVGAHPALKAASPQAPVTDWFVGDDFHRNGVFWLPHAFNFLAVFGHPRPAPTKEPMKRFDHETPDGYEFFLKMGPLRNADERYFKGDVAFWNEMMEHSNYDDYWKARNVRQHLKNIKPAVLTVGGWFDAENLFGALECYKAIEANSPGATNTLVMGPWYHGQWARDSGEKMGNASFDAKTGEFYRDQIIFPFFEHHLNGKDDPKLPEAMVFQTGVNQWRRLDAWPPKSAQPKSFYLQADGKLALEAPPQPVTTAPANSTLVPTLSHAAPDSAEYDEYVSDPAHPVPFIEGVNVGMTREYMTDDQRFASRRPDVLVYQTEPLAADLTLAGPIIADLKVSTSGTDSDWVVKVIDVYPNDYPEPEVENGVSFGPSPNGFRKAGYQQLVRGEMIRGKFRDSLETPKPFEPNQPTTVRFQENDIFHTFRTGHRVMIQIQSSWFPLADRNPQKFEDIYHAQAEDFQKATQRVYHAPGQISKIEVLVEP